MSEQAAEPDVYLGIDVGEAFHHAVALGRGGEVLLDQQLPNDETEIREVIAGLRELGTVLLVVDQPSDANSSAFSIGSTEIVPGAARGRDTHTQRLSRSMRTRAPHYRSGC